MGKQERRSPDVNKFASVYTNYRWEAANVRKGDRFYYKRDVVWPDMPWRTADPQVICTVQYDSNSHSPYWGKWHVEFGAQSPALNRLRLQMVESPPKFASKDDAIALATAMIAMEGLT